MNDGHIYEQRECLSLFELMKHGTYVSPSVRGPRGTALAFLLGKLRASSTAAHAGRSGTKMI